MAGLRVLPFLSLLLLAGLGQAAELKTYFPSMNLERFIAENLDISDIMTVPMPFAPRPDGSVHFDDIGYKTTIIEAGQVTFTQTGGGTGTYILKLVSSGDYNGDGIEDILICFTEKSKQGAVLSSRPYVVTRTSSSGRARAVPYTRTDKPCG